MYRFEVWSRHLQWAVGFQLLHQLIAYLSLSQTYVATASVETRAWASEVLMGL